MQIAFWPPETTVRFLVTDALNACTAIAISSPKARILAHIAPLPNGTTTIAPGRDWRLIYVDGHGSHLNMKFLNWYLEHRVLVAGYRPHSTHRVQPLDVSLFAPLGIYHSQEFDAFIHQSQGICSVTKRDFFGLFWGAYIKAFTEFKYKVGVAI